jgi:hypothetical protein
MKGKTKKIILAVAVIGALAAGGAAFTASNTVPNTTAGYGTSTITGATVDSISYTTNGDGTQITDAKITLPGDLTATATTPAKTVRAGFGTDNLTDCTLVDFNTTTAGSTTYTCTGYTQDTTASASFNVVVTS